MRTIYPLFATVLLCLNMAKAQSPYAYYTVQFPNDTTIFGCGATVPTIYPIINKMGNCSYNVGVSKEDQVFYTNSCQNCYKIARRWRLLYWCDYNPNWQTPYIVPNPANSDKGPLVNGDVYNHGYIEYTQIIKVLDNVAPIFIDCPSSPVTICDYSNNNPNLYNVNHIDRCEAPVNLSIKAIDACSKSFIKLNYRLFLDMDGNGSMETLRNSGAANAWPVETTAVGDTLIGTIKFPQGYELPYGTHKIEWIAGDYCGPESVCKYEFTIKDCKKPTVVCCTGLGVNLMQTGMVTMRDSTFLLYATDNCTKTKDLKIGIRKVGTGTGFPTDRSVTFNCDEVGQQFVEIWAKDAQGNADYCKTYVNIQDNMGNCVPPGSPAGRVVTEYDKGLAGANVRMLRQSAIEPFDFQLPTDQQGYFISKFLPYNCNFRLIPSLDTLPARGVTAMDAMLLAAHIDDIEPIYSPYSQIAGDVNRDNKLTYADVDLITKVANGSLLAFPNVASWRFVPKAHDFMSDSPFTYPFPESITAPCANGYKHDFIAIKSGDVNGTAGKAPKGNGTEDRNAPTPALLQIRNEVFRAGDALQVPVYADAANLSALQFTLAYHTGMLRLENVEGGLIQSSQTGIFEKEGKVTAAWYAPAQTAAGQPMFTLTFRALSDGNLGAALDLNSSLAEAIAYDRGRTPQPLALDFGQTITADSRLVFNLSPNPTQGRVRIAFRLPEAGEVRFSLTDAAGKVLQTNSNNFDKGYSEYNFDLDVASGMYFLRMESASGVEVRSVVKH